MKKITKESVNKIRRQLSAQATQMSKTMTRYYEAEQILTDPEKTPFRPATAEATSKRLKEVFEMMFDSKCSALITMENTDEDGRAELAMFGSDVDPVSLFLLTKHMMHFKTQIIKDLVESAPAAITKAITELLETTGVDFGKAEAKAVEEKNDPKAAIAARLNMITQSKVEA